ncbi:O-antigen ligase family protein [Gordonia sp. NPDC003504]
MTVKSQEPVAAGIRRRLEVKRKQGWLSAATFVSDKGLVSLVTATAPIGYLPLETGLGSIPLATIHALLTVWVGIRLRVFRSALASYEVLTCTLCAWIVARLVGVEMFFGGVSQPSIVAVRLISIFGASLIAARICSTPSFRESALRGLAIGALIVAAYTSFQLMAGLTYLQSTGYRVPRFRFYTEAGDFRPVGSFFSPTVLGAYAAIVSSALIWQIGRSRWLISAGALSSIFILLSTQTRAAWIAFAVASVVASAILVRRSKRARAVVGKFLLPGIIGFVVVGIAYIPRATAYFDDLSRSRTNSNLYRTEIWTATIRAILSKPLSGYGRDTFKAVIPSYAPERIAELGHAHNNFLQVWFTLGFVGFMAFLSLIACLLWSSFEAAHADVGVRLARSLVALGGCAGVVAFTVDSFFETTWTSYGVVVTMFIVFALSQERGDPQFNAAKVQALGGNLGSAGRVPAVDQ